MRFECKNLSRTARYGQTFSKVRKLENKDAIQFILLVVSNAES